MYIKRKRYCAAKRLKNLQKTAFSGLLLLITGLLLAGCKNDGRKRNDKDINAPVSSIIVERDEQTDVISDDIQSKEILEEEKDAGENEEDAGENEEDAGENEEDAGENEEDAEDAGGNDAAGRISGDDVSDTEDLSMENSFYYEEISDEVFARMEGKSFPADCMVLREDLRYLHLLYKDIEGETHEGEMVCNSQIAEKVTEIFRQLYMADYPIERMKLIDDYDADDDASMSDNNTSCFNYRVIKGTNKISRHGYGLAVDINPRYNPYIHILSGETVVEPENGEPYADRTADFDYKIDEDDLAYKLFTEAGFSWGGSWKNSKDYQHFQID